MALADLKARAIATQRIAFEKVAELARQNGMTAEVTQDDGTNQWGMPRLRLILDGIELKWRFLAVAEETSISAWRKEINGKIRLKIDGGPGNTLTLPERKDGTHDYGRALAACLPLLSQISAEKRREANRKAGLSSAQALMPILGACASSHELTNGMAVEPSPVSPDEVLVTFHWQQSVTPERAKEVAEALKALGIHTPNDY